MAVIATVPVHAAGAYATEVTRAPSGRLADGSEVEAITLKAGDGVSAVILSYGATLQKFPDAPNHSEFVSARVDPGKPLPACHDLSPFHLFALIETNA